jgi:hypothetical protein
MQGVKTVDVTDHNIPNEKDQMKTTVCVAVVLLTLAVLLQFTGDNLAEASRRRYSR